MSQRPPDTAVVRSPACGERHGEVAVVASAATE